MELANMIPKEKTTLEKILSSYKVRQVSLWALDMCGILISVLVSMILTWKYQNLDINTIMLSIINAGTLFTAKLHIIQNRSKNTITIAIYIHNADTVLVFISLIENSQINIAVVP